MCPVSHITPATMANKPKPMANSMANATPSMANKEIVSPVSSTYKYRNREKRRDYMRDLMREKRGKK